MIAGRHIIFAASSLLLAWTSTALAADDRPWTVGKSSGEVWIATPGVQQASLSQAAELKPGDTIRTGRTGRVLLVRGEESIMIAPNSSIGIPQRASDGLSTTIAQQAGSILLEVEKRNVKHFEVETPYLAAVVKGTQFRVSVDARGTHVDVLRGQVEVADFKSGQIAQILPGQSAASFGQGKIGLSLSGSGSFGAIEQGQPRPAPVERLQVPRTGLGAPHNAGGGMHVLNIGETRGAAAVARSVTATALSLPSTTAVTAGSGVKPTAHHALRIAAPIGDVRLNFSKVTNGLAHGA
ncbi:MAG: FecR family protein, partial [Tardiphaga sp.]